MNFTYCDLRNFYSCDLCPYKTTSLLRITTHMRQHHRKSKSGDFSCESNTAEKYKCEFCGFETDLKVILGNHVNIIHKGSVVKYDLLDMLRNFNCRSCDFRTFSLLVLTKHVWSCGQDNDLMTLMRHSSLTRKSTKNLEVIKQKYNLKKHERLKNRFKCEQWWFKSWDKKHLLQHIEVIKWFECEQCAFKSRRKGDLNKHVARIHEPSQDWFKCEQCSKDWKTHASLKHALPEKWLECVYKAEDNRQSTKHTLAKLGKNKWFQCEQCPFQTKRKFDVKRHVLTKHTNSEDVSWHQCGQCPYKTQQKSNLKRHISRHHLHTKANL